MQAIRFIIMAVALPKGHFPWRQATAQAGQGERYDQILAFAYPDNSLSRWGAPRSTCQLLPKAKAWLAKKMPQWRRILQGETGYNEPDVFAVCRLVSGFPIPIGSRNGCLFVTSLRFRIGWI